MDISKLSDEDLVALKAGGLSAVSDEGLMALKGESAPESSTLRQKGRSFLTGGLLGFGDEAVAGVAAIPAAIATGRSIPEAYRGIRDAEREAQEQYREDFPIEAMGTELAGGLITGGVGAARVGAAKAGEAALKAAPRVWRNTKLGAGAGGLAGLGYSEADALGGMAGDTLTGALIGGVTGGAVPEAMSASGQLAMNMINRLQNRGQPAAETFAGRKIQEAMTRDDMTPEQLMAQTRKGGEGFTLADAGGENLQTLLEVAAKTPGAARNQTNRFMEQRARSQINRMDDMLETVFDSEDNFREKFRQIVAARREEALPMYSQLHEMTVDPSDYLLDVIMKRPSIQGAMPRANALLKEQDYPPLDPDPYMWSMREWDFVKQGLVDHANDIAPANPTKGMSQMERQIRQTERELVEELDELTGGAYQRTLNMYAGHKRNEEALDLGRKFMRADSDYLDEMIDGFGPQELEAFRMGALRAIRDKVISRPFDNDAAKQFDTPKFREQLEAILPDPRARTKFMRQLWAERKMNRTQRKVTGGSPTEPLKQAAMDSMTDPNVATATMTGGPKAGMMAATGNLIRSAQSRMMPESERASIAGLLTDPNIQSDDFMKLMRRVTPQKVPGISAPIVPVEAGLLGAYPVVSQ